MELTADQLDALQELINVGVGQAAGMLNEMIEFRIQLQVPLVKLLTPEELLAELSGRLGLDPLASVQLEFTGSFGGTAQLVFPTESAANLVALLTGEKLESPDLDSLKIGTLTEVGNIVINGVMGSISNMLSQPLHYSVPIYTEEDVKQIVPLKEVESLEEVRSDVTVLLAQASFEVEALQIKGDIVLFFGVGSFDVLLEAIALAE